MDAFNELRRIARQKRDNAIAKARDEYAETLTRIAGIEQDLRGREPANHRSIASCIDSVVPGDRPFSTTDILASLEALDPRRVWRKRSIDSHISRLRERGIIRRLRKATITEPALYAREGLEVDMPFEDKRLKEVVYEVLGQVGPANQTELVVAMLEAGYQTEMGRKALRDAVGVVLRGDGRFAVQGGKWRVG